MSQTDHPELIPPEKVPRPNEDTGVIRPSECPDPYMAPHETERYEAGTKSPEVATADDPRWSGWDVLLLAIAFWLTSFVGVVVAYVVLRPRGITMEALAYDARVVVPVQSIAYLVVLGLMYLLVTHAHHRPFWEGVYWNWPARAKEVFGLIVCGMFMGIVLQYAEVWLPMPKSLPMEKLFKGPSSAYLMAAMAVLAAPLIEELFFRGFLYPVLRRIGAVFAVITTSLAFAGVHGAQYGWAWAAVLLLFVVGLVLTLARARTGSVAVSFLVHVGYNLVLFVMLYFSSDHFRKLGDLAVP